MAGPEAQVMNNPNVLALDAEHAIEEVPTFEIEAWNSAEQSADMQPGTLIIKNTAELEQTSVDPIVAAEAAEPVEVTETANGAEQTLSRKDRLKRFAAKMLIGAAGFAFVHGDSPASADKNPVKKNNVEVEKAAAASVSGNAPRYIKRHSKLQPQSILSKIAYTANPIERQAKARPNRATLKSDRAEYYSPGCRDAFYSKFIKDTGGITYATCAAFPPGYWPGSGKDIKTDRSKPGQYQPKLNIYGGSIMRSVGITEPQEVRRIGGNRSKLTVIFECPSEVAEGTNTSSGIERATLRKARKGSKATLKKCVA